MANFWASLSPAERQALAAVARERVFARGARLMSEGEQADYVMVILSGSTQITAQGEDGARVIAVRGPGQIVGERGALRLHHRSTTVVALEMVRALVLRTEDFASFISERPGVLGVVENLVYDRIAEDPEWYGRGEWSGSSPLQAGNVQRLAGENCTVILTDVVGFGARHRNDQHRQIIRREGMRIMRESLGPVWETLIWEDRGDGLLMVVPPRVPTTKIVECIHRELPNGLRLHNSLYAEAARFRLRIAVNVGPVVGDRLGMTGDAIIRTARLVEAQVLKDAMAENSANLGIIVSSFVYETAIEQANELIDAHEYKMVEVLNKEFHSQAWMRLVN